MRGSVRSGAGGEGWGAVAGARGAFGADFCRPRVPRRCLGMRGSSVPAPEPRRGERERVRAAAAGSWLFARPETAVGIQTNQPL